MSDINHERDGMKRNETHLDEASFPLFRSFFPPLLSSTVQTHTRL